MRARAQRVSRVSRAGRCAAGRALESPRCAARPHVLQVTSIILETHAIKRFHFIVFSFNFFVLWHL